MTHLIASIQVKTVHEAEVRSDEARDQEADTVELRVDGFRDAPSELNRFLLDRRDRNWIITCRSRGEGGYSDAPPDRRAAILADIVCGTTAYVDFEHADWRRSRAARETITSAVASTDRAKRIILSAHNFDGPFDEPGRLVVEMLADPSIAVAKIAYNARTAAESFAALDLMRRYGDRVCAIAMGWCGAWTRLLAKKLNAWATFAALNAEKATAPGQMTVRDMIERFRWSRIGPSTKVFGVIGDPVAHSMSPLVFNDWFEAHDVDGVYVPLHVRGGESDLHAFLHGMRERPWLDVRGTSVTLPHKKAALEWCGGGAESMARTIGAANTLVFSDDRTRAFNTDCYAAIDSICAALGCHRRDLHSLRVDFLGAGGVARAIVYGLQECGCRGTIYGRTIERARALADAFDFEAATWNRRAERSGDLVINATSVGMWPEIEESPLHFDALGRCRLVFDTIYNPIETRLLADARRHGVATLNGLDMFVRQAAMQFELWAGQRPDTRRAAERVQEQLEKMHEIGGASNDRASTSAVHAPRQSAKPSTKQRGNTIILIGLRGSGKTTVGRLLAEKLGTDFVDTDEIISSESAMTISEIFDTEGEDAFRRREREAVAKLVALRPGVISVGGGAVLDQQNVRRLRACGKIVWLTAPPPELWSRISTDTSSRSSRPPLTSLAGSEELQHLAGERQSHYENAADVVIDTSGLTPERVTRRVLSQLNRTP